MSTRDHARCEDCGGCATCGVHTGGVTCNGTLRSPLALNSPGVPLTDEEVSEFRKRLEEALDREDVDRLGMRILPPGRPPPGKFRVTIRVERPDGQFATSSREVTADLLSQPEPDSAQEIIMENISDAFVAAYRRAAKLPD